MLLGTSQWTRRCEKRTKVGNRERSINKRWLFIPNKAACHPCSLAVQRLHLWLLSSSNYWLAEAFEKSVINSGIRKKKQQKTAVCFPSGTVIDEALRNNTPTEASSPTVNYGRRLPSCCYHISFQSRARTIVINDYKTLLMCTYHISIMLKPTARHKLLQQANETSMDTKLAFKWI